MSQSAAPLQARIDAAREALTRSRRLLCEPSPANLQLCCGLLANAHEAIDTVRSAAEGKKSVGRGLAVALASLRSEIGVIGLLLERAATFHANLLKDMVAASSTPEPLAGTPHSTRPAIGSHTWVCD
jgi:hypothetical protein